MYKFACHPPTVLASLVTLLILIGSLISSSYAFRIKSRSFVFSPKATREIPKLVIISGCPGTGKSTFGMSVALDQGILKCISTDTVRAVMRSFIPPDISPALHRSSYMPAADGDDPVRSWRETCTCLETSVEGIVEDALSRGVGLVLEGVSIAPSEKLIKKWEDGGGAATGCLLTVPDEDQHKSLLMRRGFLAGEGSGQKEKDADKIKSFDRVRQIQEAMIGLAEESNWLLIEQKVEPDALEIVSDKLYKEECDIILDESSTTQAVQKRVLKEEEEDNNDIRRR